LLFYFWLGGWMDEEMGRYKKDEPSTEKKSKGQESFV
jgi:hypothetical protein